jgi:uncharacterized protein (DUF2141 family)
MKCVVFIFSALWSQILFSQNYDLSISITNIKGKDGDIVIGLYNNKESFPLDNKQYKLFSFPASQFCGVYVIKNLPEGEFAVALFHDRNSDKICNTNFIGIPKEGYAFSRNFRPKLSAPKFEDCKFELRGDSAITIKLNY